HHLLDPVEIVPVEHRVERERKAELLHPAGDDELPVVGAESGDAIRGRRYRVLDRNLDVVEAQLAESSEPFPAKRNPAGDQVRVEIEPARFLDEDFEVVAHEGLAAGEIQLHDAEILGFAEDAAPGSRVELSIVAPVVEWIR